MFTPVKLFLFVFTIVLPIFVLFAHARLPTFICLHVFTYISRVYLWFTPVYSCLPIFTRVYLFATV